MHRRAVRQALASPLPPALRAPSRRSAPKLGAYRALIDGWLEADREAPHRQRHTAKRIWRRRVGGGSMMGVAAADRGEAGT